MQRGNYSCQAGGGQKSNMITDTRDAKRPTRKNRVVAVQSLFLVG